MNWLLLLAFTCIYSLGHSLDTTRQGPAFSREPPSNVAFSNATGAVVPCVAHGNPIPRVSWVVGDILAASDIQGIRHSRPTDGSLVFLPFKPEEFRQEVHDTNYRCLATNSVGSVISKEVRIKGVVQRPYAVDVYDEFVIRGNTAVLRCNIPSMVHDYVTVTSWTIQSDANVAPLIIRPTSLAGDRFSVFPTGELHIRRVEPTDGVGKRYRCETRHRLTGETVQSATAGRLLLTETFRKVPPRIMDARRLIKGSLAQTLEVPCAAQGYPAPTYRWYRKDAPDSITNNELLPLQAGHNRLLQLDGTLVLRDVKTTDSGQYLCQVNNSAGTDSAETEILITAPLSVQVWPRIQSVDVGQNARFNCSVSGHPVTNLEWRKDGRPLRNSNNLATQFLAKDVLTIDQVQRRDRGMYQCFASNEFDSAQGSAELQLGDYPPVLLETFEEATMDPGPSLSLKCIALGSPLPQVTWTLDGAAVPEEGIPRYRMGDYVRSDSTVVSYVNVTSVRVEDGGWYECNAKNDVGSTSHGAKVNVKGEPFVRPLGNASVVAGDTLQLRCPVGGYPIQTIRWEMKGSRLPANHRQKVFPNGTLLVRNVERASDEGSYTCVASNKEGITAQSTAHVYVLVRPEVSPFSFPTTLQEARRFSVLCTITKGDSPILIEWYKDGHRLPKWNVQAVKVTEFSSSLVFDSLQVDHSGNYTCEASNRAGSHAQSATMVIHVPPRWKVEPRDREVTKGSSSVIDCQAEGHPQPRIRWTKSDEVESTDGAPEFRPISSSSRLHVFENGSLVLRDVHVQDSGSYLCQAHNGVGQGLSKVVRISVHVAAHFKNKFRSETVQKGQDAKLSCEAVGDRPIRLQWLKDKQPFEATMDVRYEVIETILETGATAELTIRRADRRDSALYTCVATNAYGRDDTNIQLIMQEPPDSPQDVKVLELGSRSVKLGWSPPYSGNSPVTRYSIEYKEENEVWQTVTKNMSIAGTESTVSIRGLLPVTSYHFRLSAANTLGWSDPSHVLQVSTDEEAPGGPPQKVKAYAAGAHAVKVTWKPPRKNLQFGVLKGYYVGYKEADSKETFVYKTLDAVDLTGGFPEESQLLNLKKDTKYAIIVQGFNGKGAGPPSDIVAVRTLRNDPPGSPKLKVVFTNHTSVALSWTPNPDDDNPIDGYILHEKWDVGEWRESDFRPDQQNHLLTELKCGSKYQFFATAYNTVGRGPPSEVVRTRTDGIPPVAPDKHSLITSVNETIALVRPDAWHDGGCPIHSFALRYRAQRKPGSWTVLDRTQAQEDGSPLILSNLVPGTWYQLQVTATNEAGSTDAEYSFATAISSDGSTRTILLDAMGDTDTFAEIPFYLDIKVLVPAAVSVAVVIVLLIVSCLVAGHKNRRHSCDARHSGTDPYGGSRKKSQMARESVPLSDVEKSSLKKTLSSASARDDYYPVPYATTRISNAEQEQQQKEAARLHQVSSEEPLYATVKRTPRPPRSDIHIYHYPGEIHELFIQEGEKELMVEDAGASTSHWRQCSLGQKSDDFSADLSDCNRPLTQSYRYSQRSSANCTTKADEDCLKDEMAKES